MNWHEFEGRVSKDIFLRVLPDRISHLIEAALQAPQSGFALEFGVWKGASLSALANTYPNRTFYGFDSFKGLPEEWMRSFDGKRHSKKGEFRLEEIPAFPDNVQLIVGYFEDTLDQWLRENQGTISFVHIDSDLYSSAKLILSKLNSRLQVGSVIVFDEFRDWLEQGVYQRWRDGEALAFMEWSRDLNREFSPLFRTNWIEGSFKVTE